MEDSHGSQPIPRGDGADPRSVRAPIETDGEDAEDSPESASDSGEPDQDNGWLPV